MPKELPTILILNYKQPERAVVALIEVEEIPRYSLERPWGAPL